MVDHEFATAARVTDDASAHVGDLARGLEREPRLSSWRRAHAASAGEERVPLGDLLVRLGLELVG